MLIDQTNIILIAGNGGPGKVSFYPGRRGKASGGNGGDGGSIYLTAVNDITILNQLTGLKQLKAEDGQSGGPNKKTGKKGDDLNIHIPVGSIVSDTENNKKWEFTKPGQTELICSGGKHGIGNSQLKMDKQLPPTQGETRNVNINLKIIADYGLIGLPNAGKTSLLNYITRAHAKTATYAFTTLEPNLGALNGKIIADIPGLIQGAATGKGLGHRFLKHIEKVKLLIHCISAESTNLTEDYRTIRQELKNYNPNLLNKPEIVVLTKTDLLTNHDTKSKLKILKQLNPNVKTNSIYKKEPFKLTD